MMKIKPNLLFILFLCLIGNLAFGQEKITASGTIKDNSGDAIPGVTVTVKGSNQSAVADNNGHFELKNVTKNSTLIFTSVGYEAMEAKATGTPLTIVLQNSIKTVDEVVVTALGIKKEQKAIGYAVSTVNAKDIQTATPNIASALYGKAAGVKIQTSPGGQTGAVSMQVRGINSISFNNQPLYILDGVPMRNGSANTRDMWTDSRVQGNGILDLNPDDIESVSILRGAAASALYGSEAVNGVVLITTKSGKGRKKGIGVDVGMNAVTEKVAVLPALQNEFGPGYGMNGTDWNGLLERGANADGFYSVIGRDGQTYERPGFNHYGNFGPKFDGRNVMWWDGVVRKFEAQPNNVRDIYDVGNNTNYNVTLYNTGDLGSFRFSYNRNNYKAMMPGSKQTKNNFNFNGTLKVSDKLSLDLVTSYVNAITNNRPYVINNINAYGFTRGERTDVVRQRFQTSKGYEFTTDKNYDPDEYLLYSTATSGYMDGLLWRQLIDKNEEKINRFLASATLNYKVANFLNIRGRLGNDFTNGYTENMEHHKQSSAFGTGGAYSVTDQRLRITYGDVMAIFNKKVGEFDLSATLGYLAKQEEYTSNQSWTDGGLVQEGWFSIKNSVKVAGTGMSRQKKLKNGKFAILDASYKNMLFAEASIRQEKVSTLPEKHNTFTYPTASLSWLFSETFKDKLPTWVNYGKLRGSYGVVGNEPEIYAANIAYGQTSVNGVTIQQLSSDYGNDNIRPEMKHEVEFGIESKLFKNRLGVDITYYNNVIIDQIIRLDVPGSAGAKTMLSNIGKIGNTGIEIALNGTVLQTSNWRWDLRFNYAHNRNEVKELPDGLPYLKLGDVDNSAIIVVAAKGHPFGDLMTYSYKHDDKGNRLVDNIGAYIKEDKYTVRGNATPKGIGGLASSLSWTKDFGTISLDMMFDYRIGGDIFSLSNLQNTATGKLASTLQYRDAARGGIKYYCDKNDVRVKYNEGDHIPADAKWGGKIFDDGIIVDAYTEDGTKNGLINNAAEYYLNNNYWFYGIYDNAIYDNSYAKLRELTLSYAFPKHIVNKLGVQNAAISLIGRNLAYLFKNLPNVDPESAVGTNASELGFERYGIPTSRSYGVALKIGF